MVFKSGYDIVEVRLAVRVFGHRPFLANRVSLINEGHRDINLSKHANPI